MLPDRVSNPGPLTYESGALPIALRGPQSRSKPEFYGVLLYKNSEEIIGKNDFPYHFKKDNCS